MKEIHETIIIKKKRRTIRQEGFAEFLRDVIEMNNDHIRINGSMAFPNIYNFICEWYEFTEKF